MVRVVNISPWRVKDANAIVMSKVSDEVDQALQETGMVVITGHGIPKTVLDDLLKDMDAWFTSMSAEDKERRFTMGPYGCLNGGYTKLGIEAVAASVEGKEALKNVDGVESFVFRGKPTNFKGEAPSMQVAADAYYDHVTSLLATLHAIICRALGVDEKFFYETGIIPSMDIHSLKLSYYPQEEGVSLGNSLRYGAHTDFQDITVLRPSKYDWMPLSGSSGTKNKVATTGGLQVFNSDTKEWECVVLPPHNDDDEEEPLCVNLGDFWEIWSHGKYISPLHRVTARGYEVDRSQIHYKEGEEDGEVSAARKSVIFFSVPDDKAVIKPLPGTLPAEHATTMYDGMERTAGEHLALKLARINV